jgi:hypothetical protein
MICSYLWGEGGGVVLDKTGKEEKFVKKKDFQKV